MATVSLKKAKGVKYFFHPVEVDPFAGRCVRLLVPLRVDDELLWSFLISQHARNCPEPDREFDATFSLALGYYATCFEYLLRRRSFNIHLLSSPRYHAFTQLKKTQDPPLLTDDIFLDNLRRLLKWGASSEPTEVLLHKARYTHPEWLPVRTRSEDAEEIMEELLDRFSLEFQRELAETDLSLEDFLERIVYRLVTVFLFGAERILFSVLAEEIGAVYERVRSVLSQGERDIFKWYFFPNPQYFGRILFFDASPVVSGWSRLCAEVEKHHLKESGSSWTGRQWNQLWRAYLAFYPYYSASVREAEREYERCHRKRGRSVPLEDKHESKVEPGAKPDYMVDPLVRAHVDRELRSHKTPGRASRPMTPRAGSFLSQVERTALYLTEQDMREKDIAKEMGYAGPSTVSKKLKAGRGRLNSAWETVWKTLLTRYQDRIRKQRMTIPEEYRPLFSLIGEELLRKTLKTFNWGKETDRENLEEEALRPYRPKSSPSSGKNSSPTP